MAKGIIVTFSGIDGSGKSTQIDCLVAHVRSRGGDPTYLWSRVGYTGGFEALKAIARRLLGRRLPASGDLAARERTLGRPWLRKIWLRLALADLLWTYGVRVRTARARGRVVICDRYLWDSLIDLRLHFPADMPERTLLWRLVRQLAPEPDLPLLFTVPVEESTRRSDMKGEPFRDTAEVLVERARLYDELSETARWRTLDGTKPVDEVFERVLALFDSVERDAKDASHA